MASRQGGSNSTLLAAAAGIGVALIAGAITMALSQAQPQAAATAQTQRGKVTVRSKRQAPAVSSARTRMAKLRRGAWLEASAGKGLESKTLQTTYFELRRRVATSETDQRFQRVLGDIDRDVPRTASVHEYAETPLFQQQLRHILACIALDDPEVGYVQGLNYIAAFILVVMRDARGGNDASREPDLEEADVFTIMVRLLRHPRYHMRSLFTAQLPGLHRMNHVLSSLVSQYTPEVEIIMNSVGSSPMDIHEWWFTLGTYILPWGQLEPLWDLFLVQGWAPMLRTVLGLLQHVRPYMDQDGADMYSVMASLKAYAAHLNDTRQGTVNPEYTTSSNGAFMLQPPAQVVSSSNERFSEVTPELVQSLWEEAAPPTPPSRGSSAAAGTSTTEPPLPASIMSASTSSEAVPASASQGATAAAATSSPPPAAPMGSSALGESWLVVEQPTDSGSDSAPEDTHV